MIPSPWYGMIPWYGMVCFHGMVWYGILPWYGMVWFHVYGIISFLFYDSKDIWDMENFHLADWWIHCANRSICTYVVEGSGWHIVHLFLEHLLSCSLISDSLPTTPTQRLLSPPSPITATTHIHCRWPTTTTTAHNTTQATLQRHVTGPSKWTNTQQVPCCSQRCGNQTTNDVVRLEVCWKSLLDWKVQPEMPRQAPENHQKITVLKRQKKIHSGYPESNGVHSEKQWQCKDLSNYYFWFWCYIDNCLSNLVLIDRKLWFAESAYSPTTSNREQRKQGSNIWLDYCTCKCFKWQTGQKSNFITIFQLWILRVTLGRRWKMLNQIDCWKTWLICK